MGKSIKPVTYGYPFIDLTKPEAYAEQEDVRYRGEVYAKDLRSGMDALMSSYRPPSLIDIAASTQGTATVSVSPQHNQLKENDVTRYLNYNFNGERGLDIKQKLLKENKIAAETQSSRLIKFARRFNSELVQDIIQKKVRSKSPTNRKGQRGELIIPKL